MRDPVRRVRRRETDGPLGDGPSVAPDSGKVPGVWRPVDNAPFIAAHRTLRRRRLRTAARLLRSPLAPGGRCGRAGPPEIMADS
ncbi:predicted protein [Streptomyces viridosporus ATCC 14672]|uniref:Predicted protein n=1 Tax=Streptomyces viridosporus (strain ATCC 14672 / DSM 40746 / JCM 4963 / KCTC 9882 / NRRL B-12104 / FH 1290) TaxID=566461 RepID=D6A9W9_STRV1|nr:predicted protein [Streptomyces viridosporus ATCC 14672]